MTDGARTGEAGAGLEELGNDKQEHTTTAQR